MGHMFWDNNPVIAISSALYLLCEPHCLSNRLNYYDVGLSFFGLLCSILFCMVYVRDD